VSLTILYVRTSKTILGLVIDTPRELIHDEGQEVPALIASMPASTQQRRISFGVVILLSVAFAVAMPFATVQTARIDAFLPVTQSIVLFADLITAVFLFGQFSIQPQRALLALASGYVFSGLFAFLQALDFPGAFSGSGLISGTPSGAVWLFSFWRITFPFAVIAYVLLKDANESASRIIKLDPGRVIAITIACALAATAGLTWFVAAGYLPTLYIDATRQTLGVQYFAGAMWLLNAIAIVLLFVRGRTILDIWLIVAVFVALPDLGLSSLFPIVRFSFGWYLSKVYILIASCTVLVVLLWETTTLYARLAGATILQRRERANRLMSVDEATAAIAHEISQPLGAITLHSEAALMLLERTPPDLEGTRACLTAMINDTNLANNIVTSVRALFKPTARLKTMIQMNSIVRQVLSMVENDLHVYGVSVSTEFQGDLPLIMADRTQLQQVILNLVKNAIEAMAAGSTTIKTLRLVTTQEANSVVSLSVQDSGPGIKPEEASHVFDPFFTTKPSGMGLGLSISQRIIEDHGGELHLTKTGSNGCTFEVSLPSAATSDNWRLGRKIAPANQYLKKLSKA
jgi:signal transduction histidine kinase